MEKDAGKRDEVSVSLIFSIDLLEKISIEDFKIRKIRNDGDIIL